MKLVKKKKIKNPPFYKYGYHFTDKLDSIIDSKEIKIKNLSSSDPFNEYEDIIPIYFLTHNKLDYISREMKEYLNIKYLRYFLKVDVNSYNQYPDFGSLADFKITTYYRAQTVNSDELSRTPKLLKKWIRIFDNNIPLFEFFENPNLIKDCISTTHSFVIMENIPITKIVDIWETKDINKKFFKKESAIPGSWK